MHTQRASRPHAAACTSPGHAAPGHQPHSGRKCPGLRGKGLPDHVRLQHVQAGATRDGAQLSAHLWGTWTPSVTSKSFPTEKEFHSSDLTRVWGQRGYQEEAGTSRAVPHYCSLVGHLGFQAALGVALQYVAGGRCRGQAAQTWSWPCPLPLHSNLNSIYLLFGAGPSARAAVGTKRDDT